MCAYILRNGKSQGYDSISYEMISCLIRVSSESGKPGKPGGNQGKRRTICENQGKSGEK